MLGEPNTEQFEVVTRLNGEEIHRKKIHDPFIHTTTVIKGIYAAWKALTRGLQVTTCVNGTHEVMQDVMMLDPIDMQKRASEAKNFDTIRSHGTCNVAP